MRTNHVRQQLSQGQPSVGLWLSLPSPEGAEYISRLGFDWLVVDTEHNAIDIRTLGQMLSAISASASAPMVRIPWNAPEHFKRALDAGAWGLVVPMVNSREEAEMAVEATRYPPLGARSVGGSRHALTWHATASDYYARANEEVLLVVQIEHVRAVERVDEIIGVPGIDACFIGPNDLGASMGIGLGVGYEDEDPRIVEALAHVRETADRLGVAPGIHCSGGDGVIRRIREGFRFCGMASELRYMLAGLSEDLKKVRSVTASSDEECSERSS
ncbi:MAG: aldolase/citrate lyase family protein [Chloroflexota bacterium]|nr:aldolase/citrate lyase family protein [Chloroflexota bacterium]